MLVCKAWLWSLHTCSINICWAPSSCEAPWEFVFPSPLRFPRKWGRVGHEGLETPAHTQKTERWLSLETLYLARCVCGGGFQKETCLRNFHFHSVDPIRARSSWFLPIVFLHLEQCLPKSWYSPGFYLMKIPKQPTTLDWTLMSPSCNELQGMECTKFRLLEKLATSSPPLLAYRETAQTPDCYRLSWPSLTTITPTWDVISLVWSLYRHKWIQNGVGGKERLTSHFMNIYCLCIKHTDPEVQLWGFQELQPGATRKMIGLYHPNINSGWRANDFQWIETRSRQEFQKTG